MLQEYRSGVATVNTTKAEYNEYLDKVSSTVAFLPQHVNFVDSQFHKSIDSLSQQLKSLQNNVT